MNPATSTKTVTRAIGLHGKVEARIPAAWRLSDLDVHTGNGRFRRSEGSDSIKLNLHAAPHLPPPPLAGHNRGAVHCGGGGNVFLCAGPPARCAQGDSQQARV